MSASWSFSFPVSGTVHYPASKSGGSVSYSDSVHVVVNLDTSAFDGSVRRCDAQVGHLRNSVLAGAAAIVKEKARSARRIAGSLVDGFYKYILYEVKEKLMELVTRVPMLLEALKGLAAQCHDRRVQLEKDYQQITGRYSNIFADLDKSLKASLTALDAPVFVLAKTADEIVFDAALSQTTARAVLTDAEQAEATGAIEVSRLKEATGKVVSECSRNIMYNIRLSSQIDHMLVKGERRDEHRFMMPVVRMRASDVENGEVGDVYAFSDAFPCARSPYLYERLSAAEGTDAAYADVFGQAEAFGKVESFFKRRLSEEVASFANPAEGERLSTEVMRLWTTAAKKNGIQE